MAQFISFLLEFAIPATIFIYSKNDFCLFVFNEISDDMQEIIRSFRNCFFYMFIYSDCCVTSIY